MDAKELRIGNYINHLGKMVKCNINTIYAISKIKGESVMYLPIPLTEEWWSKFDYECIQEFITVLIDKSKIPLSDDFNFWIDYIKSLPIHKIQNLYLELTSEELEITL